MLLSVCKEGMYVYKAKRDVYQTNTRYHAKISKQVPEKW